MPVKRCELLRTFALFVVLGTGSCRTAAPPNVGAVRTTPTHSSMAEAAYPKALESVARSRTVTLLAPDFCVEPAKREASKRSDTARRCAMGAGAVARVGAVVAPQSRDVPPKTLGLSVEPQSCYFASLRALEDASACTVVALDGSGHVAGEASIPEGESNASLTMCATQVESIRLRVASGGLSGVCTLEVWRFPRPGHSPTG